MYLLSGQGGEWDSQHLIREYNRNINSLYKSWTPTEPNATGLFLEPYNAGFSYQGTGDFRDYKWDDYSLDFDGVDDFIDLGSQAGALRLYNSDGTISAWIKMDDVSAGDESKRIVDKSDEGTASNGYALWVRTNGQVAGGINGTYQTSSVGVITDATWHHVVWTWDGTNYKFYIDGILDTTAADTVRPPSDTTNMRIGTWCHDTAREFKGLMDEVAIWNSALSAAQVRAIYNGGTPESLAPYSPLAWWRMGDGPLDDGNIVGNGLIGDQVNPTLGSELVLNGDMELDDNWNDLGSPTTNERSTERVYSGTYSRKCVANAGSEGLKSDTFSLVAGTVYKVSFYYYLEIAAGPTYRWIMQIKDGDGSDLDPSQSLAVTGAWTNITFYRTATATGSGSYFQVFQSLGGDSTFYLDNVSVKPVNGNAGIMKNMTASDIVADTP